MLNNPRGEGFLLTTGSNGDFNIWDMKLKNKISQFKLGEPIVYATINQHGTYVAFAQGYDWHQGINGLSSVNYKPKIGVKMIYDDELQHQGTTK